MNENGNLIFKKEEIEKTFNDCFGAFVDNLDLHHWEDKTSSPSNTCIKLMTLSRIMKNIQKNKKTKYTKKTKYRRISKLSFRPVSVEQVNVAPVFKKEDPLDKSNYRPVSILPLLSKVYEKVIYNQLSDYSDNVLNVVSERHIARNMHCSSYCSHRKKFWIMEIS